MKPTLALFLELGGSLEEWNDVGFFSREISLYNKLARDFFEKIYIFTYGSEKDLSYATSLEKNIIIIPRGKRSTNYLNNFFYELRISFKYRSILKRCDIFKTNQNSGSIAASIAKMLSPQKKLVIRSGYIGSELDWNRLSLAAKAYYVLSENLAYRICDHILIPERDAEILSHKYSFTKEKVTALNNSIDTEIFTALEKEKGYDIIYVARLNDTKNHQALLEAAKGIAAHILFIGKGENREKIEKLSEELSIDVTIIDSIPNNRLPEYYSSAKICVFPSLHEGNPKALLEAMACGLPVVTLDSPGITNIIKDKKNGLIGPEESLRGNISRLLSDQSLRDILGKEARTTVLNDYSFEKIVKKEIDTYKKLLTL